MATYSFTLNPADFADGDYTLEIIATDNSANQNVTDTDPISFTVTNGQTQIAGAGRPDIEVDIAFGQAPFTVSPDWTDVTGDVLMASQVVITRGASADNPTPTAGTINFTLKDTARKYDPENSAGPYYGGLTFGCPCRVVANYTNLPVHLVSSRAISTPNAIIASGSTSVNLAYGYIDGFPQTYADPADNLVTIPITAPDALAILARTSFLPVHPFTAYDDAGEGTQIVTSNQIVTASPLVPGLTPPDYTLADVAIVGDPIPVQPAERSGTRIKTLCELAGIPDDFLSIDVGQSIVEGGTPQETNLLDHFRTVTATEYGRFYQTPTGRIRFIERRSNLRRLNEPQANFCEVGGLGIPYASLSLDPADRRFLVNRCIRASQSVDQVLIQDQASIKKYGVFEDSQTFAFADPQDAIDQAVYVVARFAGAPCRVTSLTIKPDRSPVAMFPTVIQLELGNRYTVQRTPLGQGDPIVKVVTVEQIVHRFDQVTWETTIDLGEADTTPYFTADDPVLGLVDAGNLVAY